MDVSELVSTDIYSTLAPPLLIRTPSQPGAATTNSAVPGSTGSIPSWKCTKQIRVNASRAHNAFITSIDVDSSQQLPVFVTCSRDTTVKVWSLSLGSGGIKNAFTYRGHRHTVLDARILPSDFSGTSDRVLSNDHVLHLWDLETGQLINTFSPTVSETTSAGNSLNNNSTSALSTGPRDNAVLCFDHVPNRHAIVIGTPLSTVKLIDLRSGASSRAWRQLSAPQGQTPAQIPVRVLCVNSAASWIACALQSGDVTVFDERTGVVRSQWKAHDAPILKLVSYGSDLLITCAADKSICIWNITTAEATLHQRFPNLDENVRSLLVHGDELWCGVGNKLGIGNISPTPIKGTSKFNFTPFKGNKFRSTITAMNLMHAYKFVLLGTEDGRFIVSN